ncbi:hypothetical protein TNIN_258661 [Trichonephila inaurata madagascariensis]|uniref:DDE-1 domain-containing protein n=1 Tax=Trichonephila inaurata madagascariensis TaxID=2747483 RepID=A0A8X6XK57_9ARAC|nr:hypothetical protein TNIN_258661 [Trichonephila inaurata madagascariensis]
MKPRKLLQRKDCGMSQMSRHGRREETVTVVACCNAEEKNLGYFILLILDGHASYCSDVAVLDLAAENDVVLFCLPSLNAAWGKKATVGNGTSRVSANEIYPYNPQSIPQHAFANSDSFSNDTAVVFTSGAWDMPTLAVASTSRARDSRLSPSVASTSTEHTGYFWPRNN